MFYSQLSKLIILFFLITSYTFGQEVIRDSLYHVWMDRKVDDLGRLNAYYNYYYSNKEGEINHFRNFVSEVDEANVLKEEVDLCFKAGMDDFIGKPFNTEELINKIYKQTKKA